MKRSPLNEKILKYILALPTESEESNISIGARFGVKACKVWDIRNGAKLRQPKWAKLPKVTAPLVPITERNEIRRKLQRENQATEHLKLASKITQTDPWSPDCVTLDCASRFKIKGAKLCDLCGPFSRYIEKDHGLITNLRTKRSRNEGR